MIQKPSCTYLVWEGFSNVAHRLTVYDGIHRKEVCCLQFRHEVKHEISSHDMLILRQRLGAVMKPDPHAINGQYKIRSLYFDNLDDKALREKLDGVLTREKYRIRLYNNDPATIRLERKFKHGGLGYKSSARLTPQQAQSIVDGDVEWMAGSKNEVILGFYTRIRNEGLKAKVIVDYIREPFVFAPGNTRVTLDYDIRTGMSCTDFLNPDCVMIPVYGSPCILEVKWDNYLPDVVRDVIQLGGRRSGAFSKYAASRMYD